MGTLFAQLFTLALGLMNAVARNDVFVSQETTCCAQARENYKNGISRKMFTHADLGTMLKLGDYIDRTSGCTSRIWRVA